jgi:hypothetical protein
MTRFASNLFAAVLTILLAAVPFTRAAATNDLPDFKEVYDLVHSHLSGMADADLNRAAVQGLLRTLRGKVSLVGEGTPETRASAALVSKSMVLENDVAYIRVGRVDDGLTKEISSACQQLGATNKLKGVVLDLRFTAGDDYAAATAAADLFVAKERPLLDWGNGVVKSKAKEDAIKLPVAALVNRDTAGAAEALAAVLRETGSGLILGSKTAGGAMIGQEFSLKNGQRLRIATTPVKLGDGSALSAQGLKPDIEVAVNAEDERAYRDDAYAVLPKTNDASVLLAGPGESTNRAVRRPRISEADLVRERREGTNINTDDFTAVRDRELEKPLIRDPALARAVDLLKGLAVVRRARS